LLSDLSHSDSCCAAHLTYAFNATLFAHKMRAMLDAAFNRWAQPNVILVATDLTDLDRLIPFAFRQAHQSNARVILLHVLGVGASVAADPAGMPYCDPVGAIDSAIKTLEPWRTKARTQEIACDILVREPEQGKQAAPWFRSRASAALGQPPGHYRGTRGSSRGGQRHPAKGRPSRHHVKRDLKPERSAACQIAASHRAKLALLHVLSPVDEMRREHLPACMDSTALHELRMLAAE